MKDINLKLAIPKLICLISAFILMCLLEPGQTFPDSLAFCLIFAGISFCWLVTTNVVHSVVTGMFLFTFLFFSVVGLYRDESFVYQGNLFSPKQVHDKFFKRTINFNLLRRQEIKNPYSLTQLSAIVDRAYQEDKEDAELYLRDLAFNNLGQFINLSELGIKESLKPLDKVVIQKANKVLILDIITKACYTKYNIFFINYALDLYYDSNNKCHTQLKEDINA